MADHAVVTVADALAQPMAGLKIPSALALALTQNLKDSLEVESAEDLVSLGSDTIVLVAEGFDPKPPAVTLLVLKKWAQFFCGEIEIPSKNNTPTGARKVKVKLPTAADRAHSESEDDGWDALSEKSVVDSSSKVEKMKAKDTEATGMTPRQIPP